MRINRQRDFNSVRKRILKKLLITLLLIGIPTFLFLYSFGIKKVEVVGASRYTEKQIKEMLVQSRLEYNSVYLYLKYHFMNTPEIPFIEKIDVEMVSNHRVMIYVYEKMVTGCVNFMGEYLYFDKDGIVVESSPKKIEKVPVINGLQFNKIVLKQKLNIQDNDLFQIILNLTKLIHKYKLDVDTVSFDDNQNIILKCGDIRVLLGKRDDYTDSLSDLKNILKKAKGTELYELDMRDYNKETGYVIGKTKKSTE